MKPEWKDAPEWAQWAAQDFDGDWYWFENKPIQLEFGWASSTGRIQNINQDWRESLERRP
jgi:hypothetical protein